MKFFGNRSFNIKKISRCDSQELEGFKNYRIDIDGDGKKETIRWELQKNKLFNVMKIKAGNKNDLFKVDSYYIKTKDGKIGWINNNTRVYSYRYNDYTGDYEINDYAWA